MWLRLYQTNNKSNPAWRQKEEEYNPVWRQKEKVQDPAWRQMKKRKNAQVIRGHSPQIRNGKT